MPRATVAGHGEKFHRRGHVEYGVWERSHGWDDMLTEADERLMEYAAKADLPADRHCRYYVS